MMEAIGPKLRRQRRRLGLTLDELSGRTGISKPYLSLIETGRVLNPPSDEKLRRLEQTLGFVSGELVTQAHLQRTPHDVRQMLQRLLNSGRSIGQSSAGSIEPWMLGNGQDGATDSVGAHKTAHDGTPSELTPAHRARRTAPGALFTSSVPVNLDEAYLSGALQELVERSAGNIERISTNAVPVINKVSAGYPKDFTDLSYPRGIADEYISCPDVHDKDAFAARVWGDSMDPKYREGDIVIFSPLKSPRNGDDCFVRFEDGTTTFKRIFFENDDQNIPVIRLQPRNEKYAPKAVSSESVTGLYKAVYKYQNVEES